MSPTIATAKLLIVSFLSFVAHETIVGVMIGRQGSVIKSMSEQSNCHMQLAEMNDPYDTKERIMIINGKNGLLPDLIHVRLLLSYIASSDTV
jgi:KH domain